ncbi:MAG: YcxB family protein [Clostridia bacterium]|nr:YcxB family protein [Clostridia bacterium]
METLFENRYIRTPEIIKEIYRHYYFKRPLIIVFDILFAISFISNLLCLIIENTCTVSTFFVLPVFFLFQVIMYMKTTKTVLKRDTEVNGGKLMEAVTVVTHECVQSTASTGGVSRILFTQIKNTIKTKNLILLCTDAKMIYILPKSAFTKGTSDEFIAFMKSKGVKI